MDCKKVEKAIYSFIYGESNASELADIKVHLDLCGHCKKESEIIDDILAQMRNSLEEEAVPDGLRNRVLSKIQSESA